MTKTRDYGFDNLKFLLILSVVLGHCLIRLQPQLWRVAYRLIFSFHMPLFLFISGWFGKFHSRKVTQLLGLYALFQTVWFLFDTFVMGESPVLQYSKPSWSLWYLLALAFYTLLTPLYDVEEGRRPVVLGTVVALALLAGYDENINATFTASRFFVFQPFYVAGFYGRKLGRPIPRPRGLGWLALAAGVALALWVALCPDIPRKAFFGLEPYGVLGHGPKLRAAVMATAAVWIYVCMAFVKPMLPGRIPLLTRLGCNSLPIYLLHGFALDLLEKLPLPGTWPVTLAVTAVVIALCGSPWAARLFTRNNS